MGGEEVEAEGGVAAAGEVGDCRGVSGEEFRPCAFVQDDDGVGGAGGSVKQAVGVDAGFEGEAGGVQAEDDAVVAGEGALCFGAEADEAVEQGGGGHGGFRRPSENAAWTK